MEPSTAAHVDAAITDLRASQTCHESGVLDHLRDARQNVELAIELLEDAEEQRP